MNQKSEDILFNEEDFRLFRDWLSLNMEAVTWQGRFQKEFEDFWKAFFVEGQSLRQLNDRFEYAIMNSKIGPLVAWFGWLKNKLICFTYINKNIDVYTLSQQMKLSIAEASVILRDFFLDKNPHLEEEISDFFQMTNFSHPNLQLKYKDIQNSLVLESNLQGSNEDEVMTSMEVTLYPEFNQLSEKIQKELLHPNFDFRTIKSNMSFKSQLRVLREITFLVVLGAGMIFAVKYFNKKWEQTLTDRISIYEPQFQWLNKTLTFKRDEIEATKKVEIRPEDLEKAEKEEQDDKFKKLTFKEETRYETESEVSLTSWDSLPKDFGTADLEQSEYEELKKRGYRDSRYGNTKVYRVMMKSEDTFDSKDKLNDLLNKYGVTQVDNVKPGKDVPGGMYYNLFVPRKFLKEFMAQVMEMGNAVLYESRTQAGRNPPGKNKVFIWVKSI